jgi:hypothetical protein
MCIAEETRLKKTETQNLIQIDQSLITQSKQQAPLKAQPFP